MRNYDPFSDLIRSIEENLQRDGGMNDPGDEPRTVEPPRPPRRLLWLIFIFFLLFVGYNVVIGFAADLAWFGSLGYDAVLWTRVTASFGLFAIVTLFTWLFIAVNVLIARRLDPYGLVNTPPEQIAAAFGVRVPVVILVAAAGFAVFTGLSYASDWQQLLLYLNQTPFGETDPLFGQDVSFYMFTLPIWELLRGWLFTVSIVSIVAVAVTAGVGWRGWDIKPAVLRHLAILGALALATIAWEYRLQAYELLFSPTGVVYGAGYADVQARLPVYNILIFVTLAAALLLIVTGFLRRGWRAIGVVLAVWVAVTVVASSIYPALVQRFVVAPNELTLEQPYIANNIAMTRSAFNLDEIDKRSYIASGQVTPAALLAEPETIRNVRLWDYRPLLQTYNQIQALRQFYEFIDVDVDRYTIDGRIQQVMVAARELNPARLNAEAQTWVNLKLVYTHGYGVAMSPVAQITRDGLPEFFLKDLPVQGVIDITQPQVYFGESRGDYVIGRTAAAEFDFPRDAGYATTSFSADTGVTMSFLNRLLFALRFGDINILLSQDIQPDSQLLWRRNIIERARTLAPFLSYDQDPYIVVANDGRLYWIIDAYTTSDRFPYSAPFRDQLNYIRNSVKVVISAYDGSTNFYVVDPNDPLITAYQGIFPTLFRPLAEMPADLLAHLRYPTDIFSVQAEMYRTYHMTSATEFYNKEDVWAWPQEVFFDTLQPVEPYYVLMRLPETEMLHYVQILPFTPANRENMVAWMAANSDAEFYGDTVVYEFGRESLFFGPQQIEARINQDPIISAQLALWNQQGSSVIRGNLLVIPISNSLLYVEPLYLQAASGKIPELQRVIVATADQVVMAPNLGLALADLFGRDTIVRAGLTELLTSPAELATLGQSSSAMPATATPSTVEELIIAANRHYQLSQQYVQQGDWAAYGEEMKALQRTIEQLVEVSGVEIEEPAEDAPPPDAAPEDTAAPESAPDEESAP